MGFDLKHIEQHLYRNLCADVRLHERDDGVLMLTSPFRFPDGDHYPIYVDEVPDGGLLLTDRGHTIMHMSFEFDIDTLYEAPRAALREQITRDYGIQEDFGVFSVQTSKDQVSDAMFRLCQALTSIYGLMHFTCEQSTAETYED